MAGVASIIRELSPEILSRFAPVVNRTPNTVATIELASRHSDLQRLAMAAAERARAAGDERTAAELNNVFLHAMDDPRMAQALDELAQSTTGRGLSHYQSARPDDPLAAFGTYEGAFNPNMRAGFEGGADLRTFNAAAGGPLGQDAMASMTRADVPPTARVPEGAVRSYSVDVPMAGQRMTQDRLNEFRSGLGGHEISGYASPGGVYSLDVQPTFSDTGAVGPSMRDIHGAAGRAFGDTNYGYRANNILFDRRGQNLSDYVEAQDYPGRLAASAQLGGGAGVHPQAPDPLLVARSVRPGGGAGVGEAVQRGAAQPAGSVYDAQGAFEHARQNILDARLRAYIDEVARRHGPHVALAAIAALIGANSGGGVMGAINRQVTA